MNDFEPVVTIAITGVRRQEDVGEGRFWPMLPDVAGLTATELAQIARSLQPVLGGQADAQPPFPCVRVSRPAADAVVLVIGINTSGADARVLSVPNTPAASGALASAIQSRHFYVGATPLSVSVEAPDGAHVCVTAHPFIRVRVWRGGMACTCGGAGEPGVCRAADVPPDALHPHQACSAESLAAALFQRPAGDWTVSLRDPTLRMTFARPESQSGRRMVKVWSERMPLFVRAQRTALLEDSMGMGKTRTAWTVVAAALRGQLLPEGGRVLIVTGAILTQHWLEEFVLLAKRAGWPHHRAQAVLSDCCVVSRETLMSRVRRLCKGEGPVRGKTAPRRARWDADTWVEPAPLALEPWAMLVLDEAHKFKWPWVGHQGEQARRAVLTDTTKILAISGTMDHPAFLHLSAFALNTGGPPTHNSNDAVQLARHTVRAYRAARHDSGPMLPALRLHTHCFQNPQCTQLAAESERHLGVGAARFQNAPHHRCFVTSLFSGVPVQKWWEARFTQEHGVHFEAECTICMEPKVRPVLLACGQHSFCHDCAVTWLRRTPSCPACRHPTALPAILRVVSGSDPQAQEAQEAHADPGKMEWLLQLLQRETGKVVVFVERVAVGVVLAQTLGDLGAACVCLHGGMGTDSRSRAVRSFATDANRVLITTVHVCSVGVNLYTTKHVVFWTFEGGDATLQQAVTRVRRMNSPHAEVHAHFLWIEGQRPVPQSVYLLAAPGAGAGAGA